MESEGGQRGGKGGVEGDGNNSNSNRRLIGEGREGCLIHSLKYYVSQNASNEHCVITIL